MDFKKAIEAMKQGKSVRRSKWSIPYVYIKPFSEPGNKFGEILLMYWDDSEYCISIQDYEATDWEIYEEEDNWNLYFNRMDDTDYNDDENTTYLHEEIIELKEKILENVMSKSVQEGLTVDDRFIIDIEEIRKILDKRFGF